MAQPVPEALATRPGPGAGPRSTRASPSHRGPGARRARAFGTPSAIGQALRTAALLTDGPRRLDLLREAIGCLERSPAAYDLACALIDHGAALRRAGHLARAAEQLSRGMRIAAACGADGLGDRARAELAAQPGCPADTTTSEPLAVRCER